MVRPETTLFMLMSVDGKISTGDTDALDFDRDLQRIEGTKRGLEQYYALERQTDLFSLNTGRVMAKIGINDRKELPTPIPVNFIIIDNEPHLTNAGIEYLSRWVKTLYLVTTNENHPALQSKYDNVVVIKYESEIDFADLFGKMTTKYGAGKITIQSGGTLNAHLLRVGLIDKLSLVVAPLLVGGKDTPTLIDGESLHGLADLNNIRTLRLMRADVLKNSYLHLEYIVQNGETEKI